MEKEIYIIRHGQTDNNLRGIIQGRGVDSHINSTGEQQAKAFFEHFGKVDFDQIFTSKLIRTQQTVQPFVDAGYNFEIHEGLDEIDWGRHEGKIADKELSKEYWRIVEQWRQGLTGKRIPGGESPDELQARQLAFLEDKLKQSRGKVLICTHGRAMRALLCTLTDRPLSQMDDFPHDNVSLYKLRQDGHRAVEIELFNFREHLELL